MGWLREDITGPDMVQSRRGPFPRDSQRSGKSLKPRSLNGNDPQASKRTGGLRERIRAGGTMGLILGRTVELESIMKSLGRKKL